MMGIQATYIDDSRLCCSSIRQGEIPVLMFCSGCFLTFNWGKVGEGGMFLPGFLTMFSLNLNWLKMKTYFNK